MIDSPPPCGAGLGVGVTAAVLAVGAGVVSLWWLLRGGEPAVASEPSSRGTPRRTFLVGAAALGVGAAASAAVGRRARTSEAAESARLTVTIPRPRSAQPVPV